MKRIVIFFAAALFCLPLWAQRYPERSLVRSGNKFYEQQKYVDAEISYRRALEKTPETYEAAYNLAKTLYKQQHYDEAAKIFAPLLADSMHMGQAASVHYDNGNALFEQRKLQEALEAYKQSLRLNPGDQQAKFNLAYTQKLLENQDKDDNKDDKDKDNSGGGGGGGQQPQPQPQQGDNDGQPKDGNGDKPQPQQSEGQGGMTKQEAEQMLQAVQMGEDKTREKKEGDQKTVGTTNGKNW